MKAKFLRNHIGAFVIACALLSASVIGLSNAQAQGRHGGGSSSSNGSANDICAGTTRVASCLHHSILPVGHHVSGERET